MTINQTDKQPVGIHAPFPLEHPAERWDNVSGRPLPIDVAMAREWRRLKLKRAKYDPEFQHTEMIACRASAKYWINSWVYTFKIRRVEETGKTINASGTSRRVPFVTWPVQDDAIDEIMRCIKEGEDCLLDKSRDMGASWLLVCIAAWYWLWHEGAQIGFNSRTESDVDSKNNPKSLFWKIEYLIRNLPSWMIPTGNAALLLKPPNRTHLELHNPYSGSVIRGAATTGHASRGDRLDFEVFDEMAAAENAATSWAASRDATACRIANSTPFNGGEFTRLRNEGLTKGSPNVITMGYWNHPEKGANRQYCEDHDGSRTGLSGRLYWDCPFFNWECGRASKMDIGQNLLIDHTTSGDLFFNSVSITQHIMAHAKEFKRYELVDAGDNKSASFVEDRHGRWYLWIDPDNIPDDTNYVMFADPSYGKGSANAACAVMDVESGEFVAEFVDPNTVPKDLADQMCLAGSRAFRGQTGHAFIGWEANGPGEAMYRDMLDKVYPYTYYSRQLGKRGEPSTRSYGWTSTRSTKRVVLGLLDRAITSQEVIIHSRDGLNEALTYTFMNDGSIAPASMAEETSGARLAHGDRIIAYSGAVLMRQEAPKFDPPKVDYRPEQMGAIAEHHLMDQEEAEPEMEWWETGSRSSTDLDRAKSIMEELSTPRMN